jgi:hypothetical protein
VADAELERAGLGTIIDLRHGDDEWRAAMGLARQGQLGNLGPTPQAA